MKHKALGPCPAIKRRMKRINDTVVNNERRWIDSLDEERTFIWKRDKTSRAERLGLKPRGPRNPLPAAIGYLGALIMSKMHRGIEVTRLNRKIKRAGRQNAGRGR